MKNSEDMTTGVREVLFGHLQPGRILESYEMQDKEPYRALWRMPETPEEYLSLSRDLPIHWREQGDSPKNEEWTEPYWLPVPSGEEAFHPLCLFYTYFIECECRLMTGRLIQWMEEQEFTLTTFRLVQLQKELLGYLKESLNRKDTIAETETPSLELYVYKLLYVRMLAFLFDIQSRFRHFLGDRVISPEELFPVHLERPVPGTPKIFQTAAGTVFELARTAPQTEVLSHVESMLQEDRKTRDVIKDGHAGDDISTSISILENAWLVIQLKAGEDGACPAAGNAGQNKATLQTLYEQIAAGGFKGRELQDIIDAGKAFRKLPKTDSEETQSIAGRICRDLLAAGEQHGDENREHKSGSDQKTGTPPSDGPSPFAVLDEYVPLDELFKKLGVTDVTFNKYLKEAPVDIIKYSQKTKFIHRDDIRALMDFYKEKPE